MRSVGLQNRVIRDPQARPWALGISMNRRWLIVAVGNLAAGAWLWLSPLTGYTLMPRQLALLVPPIVAGVGYYLRRRTQGTEAMHLTYRRISRAVYLPLGLAGVVSTAWWLLVLLAFPFTFPAMVGWEHRVSSTASPDRQHVADVWSSNFGLMRDDPDVVVALGGPALPIVERSVYQEAVPAELVFVRWVDNHTLLVLRWLQDGSGGYRTVATVRVD